MDSATQIGNRRWTGRRGVLRVAMAVLALMAGVYVGVTAADDANSIHAGRWEALTNLPAATRQAGFGEESAEAQAGSLAAGTEGLALPAPRKSRAGGQTIALLGDLTPANGASEKYLKEAVEEINLLRPDAVFTVGNLVAGLTRSGEEYGREVMAVRGVLDTLKMPWYPCVGRRDVFSGTRQVEDRRFEELYQKYFGPRYYSAQCGVVHVIVLDSEECGRAKDGIGEEQMEWLKGDLNKTFEGRGVTKGTQYVVVLVHRPLWRTESEGAAGNWEAVHGALVEFNRRPIVRVEGMSAGAESRRPRVVAVYAGAARAYAEGPTRDGIRYVVVGATAARVEQGAAVAVRHFTVIRFDAGTAAPGAGGVHPAVVEMGDKTPGAGAIAGADIVSAGEREVLDKMVGLPEETMGVKGILEQVAGKEQAVELVMGNPLTVPLEVEVRLASARNLVTATQRENANPLVESLDAGWEMRLPADFSRQLAPGEKKAYKVSLRYVGDASLMVPPQVEFAVHWTDGRGRMEEVVLKRRVAIVPRAEVPLAGAGQNVPLEGAWPVVVGGRTSAWELREDEPRRKAPRWEMAADGQTLFVRVTVEDPTPSYWRNMELDWGWGGVASDAVSVAWAPDKKSAAETVRRVWVMPFGEKGPELWANNGVGRKQTPLVLLKDDLGVKAKVDAWEGNYTVTLAMPRSMVMPGEGACVMNIAVSDNDGGAETWVKSWAKEELGPRCWGRVSIKGPTTQPTTRGLFPIRLGK